MSKIYHPIKIFSLQDVNEISHVLSDSLKCSLSFLEKSLETLLENSLEEKTKGRNLVELLEKELVFLLEERLDA